MEADEYFTYQSKLFAALFSAWLKSETNVDFWEENNAEEMLADMFREFSASAFPQGWGTKKLEIKSI